MSNAWDVSMWAGGVVNDLKSNDYYVWPVRAGQTGELGDLDISVTKTDSPDPVTVGNNLTYTITVTNNGPDTATGVTLIDQLPSSVTYVSASSTQGSCTKSGNTITCNIGPLSNSASATVTIIVTPTTAGTITNTATVTCNETDTNTANNTATTITTVNASPTGCSTWTDVIGKYNAYVSGQATWNDVIACYQKYANPMPITTRVGAFYYPRYGNITIDGYWRYWDQANNFDTFTPPNDIVSDYYPLLGPYSVNDVAVIDQHLTWLEHAGIGLIIVSWLGPDGFEDKALSLLCERASKTNIKIAFSIEPYFTQYRERSKESLVEDHCCPVNFVR